jgi:hypothetical protein
LCCRGGEKDMGHMGWLLAAIVWSHGHGYVEDLRIMAYEEFGGMQPTRDGIWTCGEVGT